MEVSSGPFMSGGYHRRRASPDPLRRRTARARSSASWCCASYGPGYRVGRLLAATRRVTSPRRSRCQRPARYVGSSGRIDAEDEFEDDAHRPLVFRRTRLQLLSDGSWVSFEDRRERVDFEVGEGLDTIGVDDAALDTGLVVVSRESVGTAADVADRVPAGTDPTTPVRLRIEQVSSIEHAHVLGVPSLDATGEPRMSAGLGRPLILTTLEPDEAMRVLTGGERRRPIDRGGLHDRRVGLIGLAAVLAVIGAVA